MFKVINGLIDYATIILVVGEVNIVDMFYLCTILIHSHGLLRYVQWP